MASDDEDYTWLAEKDAAEDEDAYQGESSDESVVESDASEDEKPKGKKKAPPKKPAGKSPAAAPKKARGRPKVAAKVDETDEVETVPAQETEDQDENDHEPKKISLRRARPVSKCTGGRVRKTSTSAASSPASVTPRRRTLAAKSSSSLGGVSLPGGFGSPGVRRVGLSKRTCGPSLHAYLDKET